MNQLLLAYTLLLAPTLAPDSYTLPYVQDGRNIYVDAVDNKQNNHLVLLDPISPDFFASSSSTEDWKSSRTIDLPSGEAITIPGSVWTPQRSLTSSSGTEYYGTLGMNFFRLNGVGLSIREGIVTVVPGGNLTTERLSLFFDEDAYTEYKLKQTRDLLPVVEFTKDGVTGTLLLTTYFPLAGVAQSVFESIVTTPGSETALSEVQVSFGEDISIDGKTPGLLAISSDKQFSLQSIQHESDPMGALSIFSFQAPKVFVDFPNRMLYVQDVNQSTYQVGLLSHVLGLPLERTDDGVFVREVTWTVGSLEDVKGKRLTHVNGSSVIAILNDIAVEGVIGTERLNDLLQSRTGTTNLTFIDDKNEEHTIEWKSAPFYIEGEYVDDIESN